MRISDWSSDVCSSDLLERADDDGWDRLWPAFATGTRLFHDPFPSLVIQDEGHLLDESLGTFSGLFETVFERIQLRLGAGALGAHCAQWEEQGDASARPRRSEEHTSELQSLMRISYAVFCLKKKKTH